MSQDASEHTIFRSRFHPHRSLTRAQFRVLLALVALGGVVTSMPFVIMGAWPVAGFFGLDVLLVYTAFSLNFRAARAYETVSVTMLDLAVEKVSAKGLRTEWHRNPRWVRLERKDHDEFGTQKVDLVAGPTRIEVGGFLGPDAKGRLADDLTRALNQVRRGVLPA